MRKATINSTTAGQLDDDDDDDDADDDDDDYKELVSYGTNKRVLPPHGAAAQRGP